MSPEGTAHWASISRQPVPRWWCCQIKTLIFAKISNVETANIIRRTSRTPEERPERNRRNCLSCDPFRNSFSPISKLLPAARCDGTEHDPSSWGVTWWYLLVLDLCGALHRRISGGVKIENPLKMSSQRFITFPSVLRSGYAGSRYGLKIELWRWNLKHFVKYPL